MSHLTGQIYTVANGHRSYEVTAASASLVPVFGKLIQETFSFVPVSSPVIGFDEVIAEIEKEGIKLGIGWDNWSGAYVMAFCDRGDEYIEKIAPFLNKTLADLKYSDYFDS